MQPDHSEGDWQQPTPQPSQSPYVAQPQAVQPVVTLASEAPPAPVSQPEAPAPAPAPAVQQPEAPVPVPEEPAPTLQEPVRWQANEYIHHEKSLLWFVVFTLIIVAFLVLDFLLIRSITFGILVPVMAAALLVYTHRPPRVIDYTLSSKGVHINDHLFPFSEFKAFGVIRDGEEYSVMLLPTKRFKPGTTIYFPEEAGEAIVDMLGARLPMQELHLDVFDKIIRKLRI